MRLHPFPFFQFLKRRRERPLDVIPISDVGEADALERPISSLPSLTHTLSPSSAESDDRPAYFPCPFRTGYSREEEMFHSPLYKAINAGAERSIESDSAVVSVDDRDSLIFSSCHSTQDERHILQALYKNFNRPDVKERLQNAIVCVCQICTYPSRTTIVTLRKCFLYGKEGTCNERWSIVDVANYPSGRINKETKISCELPMEPELGEEGHDEIMSVEPATRDDLNSLDGTGSGVDVKEGEELIEDIAIGYDVVRHDSGADSREAPMDGLPHATEALSSDDTNVKSLRKDGIELLVREEWDDSSSANTV